MNINILVIDGQGGGMGSRLVEGIKKKFPHVTVGAVGTNALAAQAMLKSGADRAATGENAVIVGCRNADIIVGPVGIVIADSLWGEITPKMACAVGQSRAVRILLPVNQCSNIIAGMGEIQGSRLIQYALDEIEKRLENMQGL